MAGETIVARLRLDGQRQFSSQAQQASKDVKGIGDAADETSAKTKGMGEGKWGARFKSAARTSALALGAAGTAAAVMGVKYDASLEQATVSFKGLLGSQKAADKMMLRISKFAAETPFEQAQLVSAAQRWVGVGNSAKSVIPSMRAVGDAISAVGGTPDDVMGVVTALTQMQNKGKASAEELQQIAERNVPAFKILAQSLGLTGAQLTDKMKKGALDADTAVSALLKGMEKKYKGSMEAQSKTFTGMMSTFKDSTNIILGTAMQPLFKWLSEKLLPAVNKFLAVLVKAGQKGGVGGMVDALKKMGGEAGPAGSIIGTIARAIDGLVQAVGKFDWKGLLDFFAKLGPALSAMSAAGGGPSPFVGIFSTLSRVAGPFAAVLTGILTLLQKLMGLPGAPQVLGGLLAMVVVMKAANAATGGLIGTLAKFTGEGVRMATTMAQMVTQIIAYRTAKLLSAGADTAAATASEAQTVAMTQQNAAQGMGLVQTVRYTAAQVASKVASLAASAATKAWAATQWLLNAAMSANPIGLVVLAIAALVAGIVLAYTKVGWFRDGVNAALRAVKNAAVAVFNWIKSNWPLLVAILAGPFGIAVALIIKHFDKIKSAASAVVGAVKSILGKIPGIISSIFSGAGNFVAGLGRGLADWLNANTPFGDKVEFSILGKHVGFTIPALAEGGLVTRPGTALVGEAGPELLSLPAGAAVQPLGAGAGTYVVQMPVYLDRRQIAMAVGSFNADEAARKGKAS